MKHRRKAREVLVKFLYYYDLVGEEEVNLHKILNGIYAHPLVADNEDELNLEDTDIYGRNLNPELVEEYFYKIYPDIFSKLKEVDKVIENYLHNWPLERISDVDRAILRLSVYEILYLEEVPAKVSINEAMEIAKKYTTEKSKKFINGLLDSVYKKEYEKMRKKDEGV
jgi:N utilization substance protein B